MADQGSGNNSGGGGNGDGAPKMRKDGLPVGRPFAPGNRWRFPPGVSGFGRLASRDRGGVDKYRLLKPALTDDLVAQWYEPCDVKPFAGLGMTWGQVWVRALYVNGIRGRSTAIRELHERLWGKVPLPIKLSADVEVSDEVEVVRAMTDEELLELERVSAEAAERERALFDSVRRRLGGVVDVEAEPADGSAQG